ncbi:MAG: RES family NAD+ phosphorylase [Pseudomonadota bacterium]
MPNAVANAPILQKTLNTFLLIPSRFPPIRLYERIAGDFHDAVTDLEALTNPRLRQKEQIIEASALDDKSPSLQNWNHAPFAYFNPEGSWFFPPQTPCLEVSADIQTALAVSVAKRTRFLSQTDQDKLNLDMRVLSRRISGRFLDARGLDVPMDEAKRWALGEEIFARDVDGVIFNSLERPIGDRYAVLNGDCLERAVQGDHYRYVWDGSEIKELYSFARGDVVDPKDLQSEELILPAA